MEHEIKLKPEVGPFQRMILAYTIGVYDKERAHLKEMLDIGVIRPSSSPWASAVVFVCKKDVKFHFCIDLQKLNQMTIKDVYSIPQFQEALDCLNGVV